MDSADAKKIHDSLWQIFKSETFSDLVNLKFLFHISYTYFTTRPNLVVFNCNIKTTGYITFLLLCFQLILKGLKAANIKLEHSVNRLEEVSVQLESTKNKMEFLSSNDPFISSVVDTKLAEMCVGPKAHQGCFQILLKVERISNCY